MTAVKLYVLAANVQVILQEVLDRLPESDASTQGARGFIEGLLWALEQETKEGAQNEPGT